MESDRLNAVASKLADYARSPSLQHIRNPHSLHKLAQEIVQVGASFFLCQFLCSI